MYHKLKSFLSDTLVYGIFTIIGRFLSFILTPLYTNYLTVSQYDFLIFIFSITTFLSVFYSLGMEMAFLRFYNLEDSRTSQKTFTYTYSSINLVSFIFTILIIFNAESIVYLTGYNHIQGASGLIILAAFIPFLDVLSYIPFNYLRITRKAIPLATIKLLVIVVSLILHYVLLSKFDYQAEGAIISQIVSNFLAFLILIPIILKNLIFLIDKELIKSLYNFAIPSIPALLSSIFLQVADRPILKLLTNSETDITTYQVNYRLGIPMLIFVSVFDFAWQPFYLNHYKERGSDKLFGRILTYYCVISSLIFLLLVFFVENLVKIPFPGGTLINYKYWLGLGILPIIIIAYFFYGLYINFSIGVIIANKTISTTIALGIAVIVNLISNFILIPQFGYYGAAYSILISYFIAMLIIFLLSNKHYKVSYEWKRVSIVLLTTIIVYLLYSALNEIINNEVLILLIKISGIFLYLLILRYIGILTAGEKELLKKFFSRK